MLTIDVTHQSPTAIVAITGEVDLYSSPQVREELLKLTGKRQKAIVLNLEGVNYMDSSGLATLIEGLQATGKYKGRFLLTHVQEGVQEVFQLSHLDKVFEIYKTVDEALTKI